MAMIDYGSVVKKNGKIIQTEMFMNMKESVGFVIDKELVFKSKYREQLYDENYNAIGYEDKECIETVRPNGNFFSYLGDKELLVLVYKGTLIFISNDEIIKIQNDLWYDYELPYKLQKLEFTINGVDFKIKRLFNQNRYKLRFTYKGELYEVLYGYGVDVNKDDWYNVSPKERRYIDNWFN